MKGALILENGKTFQGKLFGYLDKKEISGEIVFQTGMVGYNESLTDPSYEEQILVYTYPLIGNYGVPKEEKNKFGISTNFESNRIHVNALVVQEIVDKYSHYQSTKSLSKWLEEEKVVGISGIDTRELTKIIRENGTMKAKIVKGFSENVKIDYQAKNLVKKVVKYNSMINNNGNNELIIIDCGIKNSQINCLLEKIEIINSHLESKERFNVKIVPYDYDFLTNNLNKTRVGVFISNGPGDPRDKSLQVLVNRIEIALKYNNFTIFGICLGHQIISLAKGYKIQKMKYGNRGHNIPVRLSGTNFGLLTSQNHGYEVINDKKEIDKYFYNINDMSNEGIIDNNSFSVQFHPEAKAGPNESNFLFNIFLQRCVENNKNFCNLFDEYLESKKIESYNIKPFTCKKILLLGSGGLSIGQAGEFDYSGSQAIKSFKEEGIEVVLVNPNIATIQTSKGIADKVYYDPITPEYVEKIIKLENPDGIALSFGGQTALICGLKLYHKGIVGGESKIKILGTPVEAIQLTEDRDDFRRMLSEIGECCAPSDIAYSLKESLKIAHKIGYPVLVRAAFALGGLGSGFAHNDTELKNLVEKALCQSSQIIIDKSLKGWKEVEYEIVRDSYDNCIAVCNMENLDPLGVHTGESIVVAPSQTLNDEEYFRLRETAFKVIRKLGVIGECNIQYALDPKSKRYFIIEVNARLSRSSALASKATGYPLAYIAGKLGLGYSLLDLPNKVTNTSSFFEPSLDYCVVKIPRWDFDKFPLVNNKIGSAMKSVGEVMAISRSFEEAFQKALRMANENLYGFDWTKFHNLSKKEIIDELVNPTPNRIQMIAYCLNHPNEKIRMNTQDIYRWSHIDMWFLYKMENIKNFAYENLVDVNYIKKDKLLKAKKLGFSDRYIGYLMNSTDSYIGEMRKKYNVFPKVKQIDTVSAEFPCFTNYLYLTYNAHYNDVKFNENGIIVLGSGVYRIGSSVEFDWCAVNCIRQLRDDGFKTVMINYNPETVSTDYDEADRLYFDELTFESVYDIYNLEKSKGIILSMGGQVANNIAIKLEKVGVTIYGTKAEKIDQAENRFKFSRMLDVLNINQPVWKELNNTNEIYNFCDEVGFPCLVRPSYVLSGAAMNVAYSKKDMELYLDQAEAISKDYPVVVSKFIINAKEIEVDAVAYKGKVKLMAISEHVENAGIHSGDATLVLPAQDLTKNTIKKIKKTVAKIGKELDITGPFNIQFMAKYDNIYVIECNLRASRTMPFVSKVFDVNFIRVATNYIMASSDKKYKSDKNDEVFDNHEGLQITKCFGRYWEPKWIGVKVPQFSFSRLDEADIKLGVEMKSTGEVACFGENKYEAYLKALKASNFQVNKKGKIIISIGSNEFRDEFSRSLLLLEQKYNINFLDETGNYYGKSENKILSKKDTLNLMKKGKVGLFIIIEEKNFSNSKNDTWLLRRTAVNTNTPVITNIKSAKMYIHALINYYQESKKIKDVDYVASLYRYKGQLREKEYNKLFGNFNQNQYNKDLDDSFEKNNLLAINKNLDLPNLLLDVSCIKKEQIRSLYAMALRMKENNLDELKQPLKGKTIGFLFDEPSSRTFLSFSTAVNKLGGNYVELNINKSSVMKGESLEDTILMFQTYVDALIIRMSDSSIFDIIKQRNLNKIPIINAGCDKISHPTQALTDILTIREERGTVNGLEISIVGDLKNSRTVKSLLKLLKNFRVKINLVPYNDFLDLDEKNINQLERSGIIVEKYNSIDDIIKQTDVLYMTRLQQERGSYGDVFIVNNKLISKGKKDLVIMHPLPRNQEISKEIDSDPRAAYFRQMKYGLWLRMALLYNLLK